MSNSFFFFIILLWYSVQISVDLSASRLFSLVFTDFSVCVHQAFGLEYSVTRSSSHYITRGFAPEYSVLILRTLYCVRSVDRFRYAHLSPSLLFTIFFFINSVIHTSLAQYSRFALILGPISWVVHTHLSKLSCFALHLCSNSWSSHICGPSKYSFLVFSGPTNMFVPFFSPPNICARQFSVPHFFVPQKCVPSNFRSQIFVCLKNVVGWFLGEIFLFKAGYFQICFLVRNLLFNYKNIIFYDFISLWPTKLKIVQFLIEKSYLKISFYKSGFFLENFKDIDVNLILLGVAGERE